MVKKDKSGGESEPASPSGVRKPGDGDGNRGGSASPSGVRRRSVVIYTDGACSGNPGPAGSGACLLYDDKRLLVSEYIGQGTNNIAELMAVLIALRAMKNRDIPVEIRSDSTYVIGVLSKGWKAKENKELIDRIKAMLAQFRMVRFTKVAGHSDDELNDLVDRLAREAIERGSGIRLRG